MTKAVGGVEASTVFLEADTWKVWEVGCAEDARTLGRTQWCTGRVASPAYDCTYNTSRGRLFILYKKDKVRPQYQLFISKDGLIEFRDGGNHCFDTRSLRQANPDLEPLFALIDSAKEVEVKYRDSLFYHLNVPVWMPDEPRQAENRIVRRLHGGLIEPAVYQANPVRAIGHVGALNEVENPVVGDMCLNGEDGRVYVYTRTGWLPLIPPRTETMEVLRPVETIQLTTQISRQGATFTDAVEQQDQGA